MLRVCPGHDGHRTRRGRLIALGVVLWAVSRALTGPAEPIDPTALVD